MIVNIIYVLYSKPETFVKICWSSCVILHTFFFSILCMFILNSQTKLNISLMLNNTHIRMTDRRNLSIYFCYFIGAKLNKMKAFFLWFRLMMLWNDSMIVKVTQTAEFIIISNRNFNVFCCCWCDISFVYSILMEYTYCTRTMYILRVFRAIETPLYYKNNKEDVKMRRISSFL